MRDFSGILLSPGRLLQDEFEMQSDAIKPGQTVLVVE